MLKYCHDKASTIANEKVGKRKLLFCNGWCQAMWNCRIYFKSAQNLNYYLFLKKFIKKSLIREEYLNLEKMKVCMWVFSCCGCCFVCFVVELRIFIGQDTEYWNYRRVSLYQIIKCWVWTQGLMHAC